MKKDKGINVLSLFNGMGCIWLALDKVGVKVNKRYSSEIDKNAIKVNDYNYPDTIQLGSVTDVKASGLEKIDLIVGGSPCQGFSFAGKGLNFEDPRSKLFFDFVRLVEECKVLNPEVEFLLENVKMKEEHKAVITKYMGVEPIEINSARVSAQNRKRLYWTNIGSVREGFFSDMICKIPQPNDKGILLKHILQDDVDEKYFLSDKIIKGFLNKTEHWAKCFKPHSGEDKSYTATSRYHKSACTDPYIKIDKQGNVKGSQDKASCFTAGGNSGGNHSDMDLLCVAMRGRNPDNPKSRVPGLPTEQHVEPRFDGKTNCLTSVQKDNMVMYPVKDYRIRRLTPIECCRLQTVPDTFFFNKEGKQLVSDTAIYKACGNGWTVDVIEHILQYSKYNNKK